MIYCHLIFCVKDTRYCGNIHLGDQIIMKNGINRFRKNIAALLVLTLVFQSLGLYAGSIKIFAKTDNESEQSTATVSEEGALIGVPEAEERMGEDPDPEPEPEPVPGSMSSPEEMYDIKLPVYANRNDDPRKFAVRQNGSTEIGTIIGYCELHRDGTAEYFDAMRSSVNPATLTEVRIPLRLLICQIAGFEEYAVYDYTDGSPLDREGYRLETATLDPQPDDYSLEEDKEGVLQRVKYGVPFFVTSLDSEVFYSCENAERIEFPRTVTSDIDYTFFKNCYRARVIDVFDASYDEYKLDGSIQQRYMSGPGNRKDAVECHGVLIDTWCTMPNVECLVVWCPPLRSKGKFELFYKRTLTTAIGPHAFENCKQLTGITLGPVIISEIGDYAFKGCTMLEDAPVFTSGLVSVGDCAFMDCKILKNVSMRPSQGTVLGDSVFANTAIEKLEIPVGYNSMRGKTFISMNSLSRIDVIPDARDNINRYYTSIDGILYRYDVPGDGSEEPDIDDGIDLVRVPSQLEPEGEHWDVEKIDQASSGVYNLPYQITDIDDYSFYRCDKLITVYFPSTITKLSPKCFFRCQKLTNIYFYSGLPDLEISPSMYTTVDMFESCTYSRLTVYAGTDTPIYNYAKANNPKTYLGYSALYDSSKYKYRFSGDKAILIGLEDGYTKKYPNIVIPDYVIEGGHRYYVTGIESSALADNQLTTVRILHHMEEIAQDAFYYIANPDDIKDPENINCENMTEIFVEPGNFNFVSKDGVLYKQVYDEFDGYVISEMVYYPAGNTDTEYTTVPGLRSLPMYAFWGAKSLRYINIYDSVQYIGRRKDSDIVEDPDSSADKSLTDEPNAFAGCTSLVMVNIIKDTGEDTMIDPGSIRYFSDNGVLYEWDPNTNGGKGAPVTLLFYPKGHRTMPDDATSPVSYEVVDGCLRIKDMSDTTYLNEIIIPKSVTTIDPKAFENSALHAVTFKSSGGGAGIQTIGDKAFAKTAVENLRIPSSIKTIGKEAFYFCVGMTDLYIEGTHLESIGDNAFTACRGLENVTIECSDIKLTGGDLVIGREAFQACTSLKNLTVRNMGFTDLEARAFSKCSSLENVSFEDTKLQSIGEMAFKNCSSLRQLNLEAATHVYKISEEAFYGCTSLKDISLPSSIIDIEDKAFYNCSRLILLNFGDLKNLNTIGERAFYNSHFISVVLPTGVTSIGQAAFEGSPFLTTFYIPSSVHIDTENVYAKGPFWQFGEDTIVYGIAGSDVDLYLQKMHAKNYTAPTFIARDSIPKADVYIDRDEYKLFDLGDTAIKIDAIVSSSEGLDDYSVYWRMSDPSVIKITKEDTDGVGTNSCVVEALKSGEVELYAINPASGKFDFCTISVEKTRVEVYPSLTDKTNESASMKDVKLNSRGSYRVVMLNGVAYPTRKVYYKSRNKNIAVVDRTGKVTAKKPGTTTVIAYAGKKDNYVETEVNITVYNPKLKLSRSRVTLNNKGDEQYLTKELFVTHSGAYENVTWSTSNPRVATVTGDNEGCIITAQRNGKCVITATCNGLKKRCTVYVKSVTTTLNTTSLSMYTGAAKAETFKLKVKSTGISKDVEWATSDETVATVSNKGVVMAMEPGKADITATVNGVTARCTVLVTEAYVKVYPAIGNSGKELKSLVVNSKGNNTYELLAKVVGRSQKVKWRSTAPNVFKVSRSGVITGRSGGVADLIVTANGVETVCEVIVIDTITELDCSNVILYLDSDTSNKMLGATVTVEGADRVPRIYWEVEDPSILGIQNADTGVTVNRTEFGGQATATFIAKNRGTTRIKVTANGISAYCKVTVR